MTKPPVVLSKQIISQTRLFCIEEIHLRFGNGNERAFERLKGLKKGAVLVVPFLDDHTILLVREYAAGLERYELGFPKGIIEPEETVTDAANRELMEEVGYGAKELIPIATLSLAPGYISSRMPIVLAQDLFPKKLPADEPEALEVVPWKWDNLPLLLKREDFTEARSIAALFLVQNYFRTLKKAPC